MKRILYILGLIFFPSLVFAQTSTTASILNPPAIANSTDLSIQYLGDIFGYVDGVLYGSGSQIMGKMFGVFNAAAMALGGIIIIYTSLVATLKTAHEGETLGKQWSSMWIPIRSAAGIGLLLPKASGYSTIQIFMMAVVVQGIGAADSIWDSALNYLGQGGVLIQQGTGADSSVAESAQAMLQSEVCMYGLQDALQEARNTAVKNDPTTQLPSVPLLSSTINCPSGETVCYSYSLPGIFPTTTLTTSSGTSTNWNNLTGVCGSVSWNKASVGGTSSFNATNSDGTQMTNNQVTDQANMVAVKEMLTQMAPVAQAIVAAKLHFTNPDSNLTVTPYFPNEPKTPGGPVTTGCSADPSMSPNTGPNTSLCNVFLNAADAFGAIMSPIENLASADSSDSVYETAEAQGWLLAGSYYYKLVNSNSAVNNSFSAPTSVAPSAAADPQNSQQKLSSATVFKTAVVSGLPSAWNAGAFSANLVSLWDLSADSTQQNSVYNSPLVNFISGTNGALTTDPNATTAEADFDTKASYGMGALDIIPIVGPIIHMITDYAELGSAQSTDSNPVTLLASMGQGMMDLVVQMWIFGIFAIGGATGALSAVPSVNLSNTFNAVLLWVGPFLWAIMGTIFVNGAVLTFYIPLIPFLLFTFGAIGWLIAVIEAMVAAPLIALGVTHPEGHEVLGKADPAVMLITNVFLRPSMMIIGFIGGIMLSYVSVWILNVGFFGEYWQFLHQYMISGAMILFAWPMSISIYTGVIIALLNQSFSLIHVLPDKVMRWIGGQAESVGQESLKSMGEVKSGTESAAGSMSQGAEKGASAAGARAQQMSTASMDSPTDDDDTPDDDASTQQAKTPPPTGGAGGD